MDSQAKEQQEYQERHRWMAVNVAYAFDRPLAEVEDVVKGFANLKKVNDFLEGRSKHKHLFFFYQKLDVFDEYGDVTDANMEPQLMLTTGEHEEMRLKGRAVYFLRNIRDQKRIKPEITTDHELLFGEMAETP